MEIGNAIKIEDTEVEIDDTTWKCLKKEVMESMNNRNPKDDVKPQSMFITFKTEDHARLVYKCLNNDLKDITPENLSHSIVNFSLDEKLRMTPIVKLEKLQGNSIIVKNDLNMPSQKGKQVKKSNDNNNCLVQSFKIPEKRSRTEKCTKKQPNSIVMGFNLQAIKSSLRNPSCERPSDIVPQWQVKGQLSNIDLKNCDLYPNDCNRVTKKSNSVTSENNETTYLMKSDFDRLWQKQNEVILHDDLNQGLSKNLFPNNEESRVSVVSDKLETRTPFSRSLRKSPVSSNGSGIDNNLSISNISSSSEVNSKKKKLQATAKVSKKIELNEQRVENQNNILTESKSAEIISNLVENKLAKIKISSKSKNLSRKRKPKKSTYFTEDLQDKKSSSFAEEFKDNKSSLFLKPRTSSTENLTNKTINSPLKSKAIVSSTEDLIDKESDSSVVEEKPSVEKNQKETVLPEKTKSKFSRKKQSENVTDVKKVQDVIQDSSPHSVDSEWKDISSSECASVLSSCKVFGRRSSDSIASSESNCQNNKIKLSRHTFLNSTKSLRKKIHTKSNIFEKILPRITSNHALFNNRSVLDENEIDLEQSLSVESQKVHVCKDLRKIINKSPKPLPVKENNVKRIIDLRDIISQKSVGQDKYASSFEVKRPPTRPSPVQVNKSTPKSSFSSSYSSINSDFLLPLSSFQQRSLPQEEDVLSIFADTVIANTSPLSDRDFDDDNDMEDYSQSYSTFSTYDIDERACNSQVEYRNDSNVNLDNNSTNKVPKINNSENLFNETNSFQFKADHCSSADNISAAFQRETESSFVSPTSTIFNSTGISSPNLFCNGVNLESAFNSFKLPDIPIPPANISKDNTVVLTSNHITSVSPRKSPLLTDKPNTIYSPNKFFDYFTHNITSPSNLIRRSETSPRNNETIISNSLSQANETTVSNSLPAINEIEMDLYKSNDSLSQKKFIAQTNDTTLSMYKSDSSPNSTVNDDLSDEFRAFFRKVCFHYLEYGFCGTKHSLSHQLPANYEEVLQSLTANQISLTYNNFVCQYSFLLEKTIPTFARYFGKYEDEKNLFDMVKKLQNLKAVKPKVKVYCMSTILDALSDFMECSVAIEKIFQNIAKKDISMIDILLELVLKEPSIENNWSLIQKLTSVEYYEIPLKVVEFILNDCCNRPKVRKFHVQKVYNDVITKIADVNLLKIKTSYIEDFVKIMEKLELNCVDDLKTRIEMCKNSNNITFKVPSIPALTSISIPSIPALTSICIPSIPSLASIPTDSFITTTINSPISKSPSKSFDNSTLVESTQNVYEENDRYSPTTSTNINNHQPYRPESKYKKRNRNPHKNTNNKKRFSNDYAITTNISRALKGGELMRGVEELRRCRHRSDFTKIIGDVVKNLSPEIVEYVMMNVYTNGHNISDVSNSRYRK